MGEIIKQSFNLYNTVGLVDKDKNIYFVPHKTDIYSKVTVSRTKVFECYYALFNEVSPFSSKYHDIEISQWSPEDRALKIDGLIDDFRQSRGQGLALNYLIMKREKYEVQEETEVLVNTYYYAMFIDSVEQVGSRSVKLNLSPDHFTNFFYLNNEDTLTQNYDPFNPVMKNCFVERQHIDRFETTINGVSYKKDNLKLILSNEEGFKYKYQYKDKYEHLPIIKDMNIDDMSTIYRQLKSISSAEGFVQYINSSANRTRIMAIFISYLNIVFKENIFFTNIYSLIEQGEYRYYGFNPNTVRYKNVTSQVFNCVLPFVSIPFDLQNIKPEWIKIGLDITKDKTTAPQQNYLYLGEIQAYGYAGEDLFEYLTSIGASQYILSAYISKDSPISKDMHRVVGRSGANANVLVTYYTYLFQGNAKRLYNLQYDTSEPYDCFRRLREGNSFVILSSAEENLHLVDGKPKRSILNGDRFLGKISGNTATYAPLFYCDSYGEISITDEEINYCTFDGTSIHGGGNVANTFLQYVMLVLGDNEMDEIKLTIDDGLSSTEYVKNNYIDPVLESDPYTFISISLGQTEQIISKVRLIDSYDELENTFDFKIQPIFSFNDSYKLGIIPIYKYFDNYFGDLKETRYYSESIVSVLLSQLPIIEDSWLQYYTVNKAQMKNQYAVQEKRYQSALWQTGVNGTTGMLSSAMKGAVRGGGVGAIVGAGAELVDSIGSVINTEIDNKFQKEIIGLTQDAKMADMGAKPDTVRLSGSDMLYSALENDMGFHINKYKIDLESYNSACKYLERFGYKINIFSYLYTFNRIGFNFVKLSSFDFVEDNFVLSQEQMEAISNIFERGVTLLHNHDFLHYLGQVINNVSYHNYELVLS